MAWQMSVDCTAHISNEAEMHACDIAFWRFFWSNHTMAATLLDGTKPMQMAGNQQHPTHQLCVGDTIYSCAHHRALQLV
jgi:hypothetical protein